MQDYDKQQGEQMTTKKTKAEPTASEDKDFEIETLLAEIDKTMPPMRKEAIKTIAKIEAQGLKNKITFCFYEKLAGKKLWEKTLKEIYTVAAQKVENEYKEAQRQASITITPEYIETIQKEIQEFRKTKFPNTMEDLCYLLLWKLYYFKEAIAEDYFYLCDVIIQTNDNALSQKILSENPFALLTSGKSLAAKVENFSKGRHPTPGSFEVAELIYKEVMDRYRSGDDFEDVRDVFMKKHCRENTTFARQIMDILYGKMKSKEREKKKLPKLPTLKSWLREYMDTMTEAAAEE